MVDSTRHIGGESDERPTAAPPLELRLYVAAAAPNSALAERNLRSLLRDYGVECSLEVIDCLTEPLRALGDGVLVTPTLVKLNPPPEHTIIGTLSDASKLAAALGIESGLRRNGTYD
jgi:circadian clock protein KaiB